LKNRINLEIASSSEIAHEKNATTKDIKKQAKKVEVIA